ncbi:hypothetical protein [Thioclava nitratireducens]|uniref:hypothetical protein n=1 Tax=Thioclava nitratireducens TaxID=1915078 RepID=UPI00247FC727|nr:hypothetical protein [Thioclava nitratireducens]WGT48626.1 hypothetical protein P0N61_09805 [Thioclava nitratireducens]
MTLSGLTQEAAAQSRSLYDISTVPVKPLAMQPARGNIAVTQQSGTGNDATTSQSGQNNVAGTVQTGSGFSSSISQTGNYQTETHFQGETRLGVTRSGNRTAGGGSIDIQFELK